MSSRSVWKGPFVSPKVLKKVNKMIEQREIHVIKTWSRNSTILPNFVSLTFSVHNGRKFIPILINEKMVGKKLGEFALTRFFEGHDKKK